MFDMRASMIARLAAVVGIAVFTGGAQVSCTDSDGDMPGRDIDSGDGPTFSTTVFVRDSSGAAASSFRDSDLISFELSVRNRTNRSVTLTLDGPPVSDYVVFDDHTSHVRWQWSFDKDFPASVQPLVFEAYETKVFKVTWDQVLANGAMLPRGNYEVRGVIPFAGFAADPLASNELGSNLVRFTVR
jgi:hypothetical protein